MTKHIPIPKRKKMKRRPAWMDDIMHGEDGQHFWISTSFSSHFHTNFYFYHRRKEETRYIYIFLAFQFKNLININYLLGTAPASLAVSQSINDLKRRFLEKNMSICIINDAFSMVRGTMHCVKSLMWKKNHIFCRKK